MASKQRQVYEHLFGKIEEGPNWHEVWVHFCMWEESERIPDGENQKTPERKTWAKAEREAAAKAESEYREKAERGTRALSMALATSSTCSIPPLLELK